MSLAIVRWIAGPVLHAVKQGPFSLRESVRVGAQALLGEVVRIHDDEIVVQVYEDTAGLRPGTEVRGDGLPLSIRVGPGLLGRIFDGLLRPLSGTGSAFVQPGMRSGGAVRVHFEPRIAAGALLPPGAVIGSATGAEGRAQLCLAPPDVGGVVESVVAGGEYADDAVVCVVRQGDGRRRELAMSHVWPVRVPRPVLRRLPAQTPLVTGQRILDCLFPVAQGGKAAIPGGFGTGKTVLLEALAKGCNADVIVYLGCGERGNEMAGVLDEFPSAHRPAHRPAADGAHRHHRQHLEHAGGGARGQHLLRGHGRRVLPRPGAARRADGRFHQPLGRGAARGVGPLRRAAGRGRLPGLPVEPARRFLRARRAGRDARRQHRLGDGDGRDQPALGGFLRAGDQPHQALREGLLGPRRQARAGALLPGHPSAAVVRRGRAASSRRGGRRRATASGSPCAGASSRCSTSRRSSSAWRASSARTRCRRASN